MSTLFDSVELAPRDPILGLNEQYNADTRPGKVNLGVGVYYDDQGRIPLLGAVRKAEAARIARESYQVMARTFLDLMCIERMSDAELWGELSREDFEKFGSLLGREGTFSAIVEPDRVDALVGAIVLEELDFVVDCTTQTLHPRDPNIILSEVE